MKALFLLACAPAFAQPLLHYDFDDQADPTANLGSLGAAFDGALGPGIDFTPFGPGHALIFDSVDDAQVHVLGDENAFDLADGDFSLAATIVTTNEERGEPGGRFIINKEKIGADDGWAMTVRRDSGFASFNIAADGVAAVSVTSKTAVNDGEPHTIVGCRSGDHLIIAVDGLVEDFAPVPVGFGSTAQNSFGVSIGGRAIGDNGPTVGPNDEFLGVIDDVMVFDVALLSLPCPADCNADANLNVLDFVCFQTQWQQQTAIGDCDNNGLYNILDFVCFQSLFQQGCR